MKIVSFLVAGLSLLTGCSAMPQLFSTAEEVLDDDAIKIVISREAIMQEDSDIHVNAEVIRKDPVKPL